MKKWYYGLIITIVIVGLSFFLYSCNKTLDIPIIALDENEVLTWNKIDGAKEYEILLNDKSFYCSDNKIDLFDEITEPVEYEIKVRALANNINNDSNFSDVVKYQVPLCTSFSVKSNGNYVTIEKPNTLDIKGKIRIPKEVNGIKITKFNTRCFEGCNELTGIICDGIEEIGSYSFLDCLNLRFINAKSANIIGLNSFYNCEKLSNIILTDSLEKLGAYAFYNTGLKKIYISKKISSINPNTFYGCNKLENVEISDENTNYYVESNCVFSYKKNELIRGFMNSIIPADTKKISNFAFSGLNIEKIDLPNKIEEIGHYAFQDCKYLKEIKMSTGLKQINATMVIGCKSLERILIDDNDRYKVINNCLIDITEGSVVLGCKNSTIPTDSNITKISENTFRNVGVKSVEIPSNIKIIEGNAFRECEDLEELVLNEGLETIGEYSFAFCYKLQQIYVPLSVAKCDGFGFCTNQILISKNTNISRKYSSSIIIHYSEKEYDENTSLSGIIYGCEYEYDGFDYYVYSISSKQKTYGNNSRAYVAPKRKGYKFIGWSTSQLAADVITRIVTFKLKNYELGGADGDILYDEEIDVVLFDSSEDFSKYDKFYSIWEKHTGNMSIDENK